MKVLLLIPIAAVLGMASPNHLAAQTFTTLHSFSATVGGTNSDGASAWPGLLASGDTLFGAAYEGGHGSGTIYKVNKYGTQFIVLHNFNQGGVVPYGGSAYCT